MSKKLFDNLKKLVETETDDGKILTGIKDLVHQNEPTKRTIVNRYSRVKKFLRDEYDKFPIDFLNQVKPDKEVIDYVVNLDNENRKLKQTIKFNKSNIDTILKLRDSDRLIDLIIYLQFISGRRINEIINDEFNTILKPKTNNEIYFSHLSKQKEPKKVLVKLIVDNITPREFKNLLNRTRNKIKDLHLNLNDLTQKVNRHLKRIFDNGINSSHNLRGMYALYLYELSGKTQNINGFLTDILNHDSTDTSLNYSNYIFEN